MPRAPAVCHPRRQGLMEQNVNKRNSVSWWSENIVIGDIACEKRRQWFLTSCRRQNHSKSNWITCQSIAQHVFPWRLAQVWEIDQLFCRSPCRFHQSFDVHEGKRRFEATFLLVLLASTYLNACTLCEAAEEWSCEKKGSCIAARCRLVTTAKTRIPHWILVSGTWFKPRVTESQLFCK